MKDPWDRTRYAPMRIRGLIDLVRPFTLLAPAVGGLSGAFIALLATGSLDPPYIDADLPFLHWPTLPVYRLLSGIISLVMLNAASNALNQVYDLPIDIVNKPYRPIPSKVITSKEGVWFAVIMYAFALWRAAFVNRWFVLMVSILVIITILYSVPPVRLKRRLWISNLTIAIPRGMLGFVAAWSIMGDITDPTPWVLGSIMAVFLIGSITTKDVTDIKGDRMYGIRTLPVQYGKKRAIIYSSPFLIVPFPLMALYWHMGMLPSAALPLSFVFMIWSIVLIMMLIREGDREDRRFENSPAWKQMYLMLMGMQVCFLAMYLI